MNVSVPPRLKLRAVAAGTTAPELVCWPMSSKKTCRREPLMCLEWQAVLHSWAPALSNRTDCKACSHNGFLRHQSGTLPLEKAHSDLHASQSAWALTPAKLGRHLQGRHC